MIFKNKAYISTTLPYANSTPHIGHCFEFVIADVLARYWRYILQSRSKVIFNVGIDEHGQKIFQAAQEVEMKPQEFCDLMAKKWEDFCKKFAIDYDNFYRTGNLGVGNSVTTNPPYKLTVENDIDVECSGATPPFEGYRYNGNLILCAPGTDNLLCSIYERKGY